MRHVLWIVPVVVAVVAYVGVFWLAFRADQRRRRR